MTWLLIANGIGWSLAAYFAAMYRWKSDNYRDAMNGWEGCNQNWRTLCNELVAEFRSCVQSISSLPVDVEVERKQPKERVH